MRAPAKEALAPLDQRRTSDPMVARRRSCAPRDRAGLAIMTLSAARRSIRPDLRKFCDRPFQHAGARRGTPGCRRTARRQRDVQSALYPRRRRAWQNHLLQAVNVAGNSGASAGAYLTAEKSCTASSRRSDQTALAFKEALRGIDVLVIDDLQSCRVNRPRLNSVTR